MLAFCNCTRTYRTGMSEARRTAILEEIPAGYSPALHFAIPALLGLSVLAGAIARMQTLRPIELLTIPVVLLGGFGFEWRVHKDILRRIPIPGLSVVYQRHEKSHHVIYTDRDMTMRSPREMWLVLMPPVAIVLVFPQPQSCRWPSSSSGSSGQTSRC